MTGMIIIWFNQVTLVFIIIYHQTNQFPHSPGSNYTFKHVVMWVNDSHRAGEGISITKNHIWNRFILTWCKNLQINISVTAQGHVGPSQLCETKISLLRLQHILEHFLKPALQILVLPEQKNKMLLWLIYKVHWLWSLVRPFYSLNFVYLSICIMQCFNVSNKNFTLGDFNCSSRGRGRGRGFAQSTAAQPCFWIVSCCWSYTMHFYKQWQHFFQYDGTINMLILFAF